MLTPENQQTRVIVGKIVGVFGLDGWIKIQPTTDFLERFKKGAKLFSNDLELIVESCFVHKAQIRVKFKEICSIDDAEKMIGMELSVDLSNRPKLFKGEFYVYDLIGCQVVSTDGNHIGTLDDVLAYAAHDLLKVGHVLIPCIKEFVMSVDLDQRIITVRLIEGMLEEPPKPKNRLKKKDRKALTLAAKKEL